MTPEKGTATNKNLLEQSDSFILDELWILNGFSILQMVTSFTDPYILAIGWDSPGTRPLTHSHSHRRIGIYMDQLMNYPWNGRLLRWLMDVDCFLGRYDTHLPCKQASRGQGVPQTSDKPSSMTPEKWPGLKTILEDIWGLWRVWHWVSAIFIHIP